MVVFFIYPAIVMLFNCILYNAKISKMYYLAFSMIHGISCLAVSGVFKEMTRDQLWEQLMLVKANLIKGLSVNNPK